MRIRLELFVKSVPISRDFYTRVLGFDEVSYQPDDYSVYRKGEVQISLQAWAKLPAEHPVKPTENERTGLGIEIVIEVNDLDEAYARVLQEKWPLSARLSKRPWGLRDFRVLDPDGYYVRITSF